MGVKLDYTETINACTHTVDITPQLEHYGFASAKEYLKSKKRFNVMRELSENCRRVKGESIKDWYERMQDSLENPLTLFLKVLDENALLTSSVDISKKINENILTFDKSLREKREHAEMRKQLDADLSVRRRTKKATMWKTDDGMGNTLWKLTARNNYARNRIAVSYPSWFITVKYNNPMMVMHDENHKGTFTVPISPYKLTIVIDIAPMLLKLMNKAINVEELLDFDKFRTHLLSNLGTRFTAGVIHPGTKHPFIQRTTACLQDWQKELTEGIQQSLISLILVGYNWGTTYVIGRSGPYNDVQKCVYTGGCNFNGLPSNPSLETHYAQNWASSRGRNIGTIFGGCKSNESRLRLNLLPIPEHCKEINCIFMNGNENTIQCEKYQQEAGGWDNNIYQFLTPTSRELIKMYINVCRMKLVKNGLNHVSLASALTKLIIDKYLFYYYGFEWADDKIVFDEEINTNFKLINTQIQGDKQTYVNSTKYMEWEKAWEESYEDTYPQPTKRTLRKEQLYNCLY
jgi:hypothetical protein